MVGDLLSKWMGFTEGGSMGATWKALIVAVAALCMGVGCGDGVTEGNDLICRDGETCENTCSESEDTCDTECLAGSNCKSTCKAGKDCDFVCRANATCNFDCTAQSCQAAAEGGASCTCTGTCEGTCGGTGGGTGGTGGGGGGDCVSQCGAPTDPGYAACVQACG